MCEGYSSKHFGLVRLKCDRKGWIDGKVDPTSETSDQGIHERSECAEGAWCRLDIGVTKLVMVAVVASVTKVNDMHRCLHVSQ